MHSIYVISASRALVKVGRSQDPDARLRELQTANGSLLTLEYARWVNSGVQIEKEAHRLLEPWRKNGEWFACDPDIAVMAITSAVARRPDLFSRMTDEETSPLAEQIREATRRIASERRPRLGAPIEVGP
jgi:hypothetical protein